MPKKNDFAREKQNHANRIVVSGSKAVTGGFIYGLLFFTGALTAKDGLMHYRCFFKIINKKQFAIFFHLENYVQAVTVFQ